MLCRFATIYSVYHLYRFIKEVQVICIIQQNIVNVSFKKNTIFKKMKRVTRIDIMLSKVKSFRYFLYFDKCFNICLSTMYAKCAD